MKRGEERMKKLMLTVGALMALEATCGELTVAPGGMTVKAAVEKIRAARASGDAAPWKVNVRGFNALMEPVVFTSADHDVEFVGEDGATVSGGSELVGWTDTGRGVRNVGGVWANNLWYDARGLEAAEFDGGKWAAWEKSGKETGSVFADPKFRDPTAFDFTLAPDSPALKLGFKPLDLTGVGPIRN